MRNDLNWEQIENAVNGLMDAWQHDENADIARFLPTGNEPSRRNVLLTLVKIDQEHRWGLGERRPLEKYLEDWPELRDDAEAIAELFRAECRIRASYDTAAVRTELGDRFPGLVGEQALKSFENESRTGLEFSRDSTLSLALLDSIANGGARFSPHATSPILPTGTQLGRYWINRVIGRGGMGTVYEARDDELDRAVAIKVLHQWILPKKAEPDLLLTEARTAAKLQHPAVVPVFDVGQQEDGMRFFVMEYVDGVSLADEIAADGVDHVRTVTLTVQVADALQCAHDHELIHRDIKPANILIDREGRARITDFGLAIDQCSQAERAGEYSGTLPYMSPEQVRGDAHLLDGRTDIWALGVILYEALTGSRPFLGDSAKEVREAILESQPNPPREINRRIPRELQRTCLKCLEKEPDNRYATAADLSRDLVQSQQRSLLVPRTRTGRMMAALAACLLVVFLFWWSGRERSFSPPKERDIPLSPWLADCKLVLTAQTGATIDLAAAEKAATDVPAALLGRGVCRVNPTTVAALMNCERTQDTLYFDVPLVFDRSGDGDLALLAPDKCSLHLRAAISKDGVFQIGTAGDDTEEHLLVLAIPSGLDNFNRFGGGKLGVDPTRQLQNHRTNLNDRQCQLATWLRELYVYLERNDAISNGPANNYELHNCPFRLQNLLPRPITVVQAHLFHAQMEFPGYLQGQRPIDERTNAVWSPVANNPEHPDGIHLEFCFDMKCTENMPSAMWCDAASDNDNASSFRVSGLSLTGLEREPINGKYSSLTLDAERGTCEGGYPIIDEVAVCAATAVLFGQAPNRVELTVYSTWSNALPSVRYATLGDVEILGSDWSPKGQEKRELRPHVWIIPPETAQP